MARTRKLNNRVQRSFTPASVPQMQWRADFVEYALFDVSIRLRIPNRRTLQEPGLGPPDGSEMVNATSFELVKEDGTYPCLHAGECIMGVIPLTFDQMPIPDDWLQINPSKPVPTIARYPITGGFHLSEL